MSHQSKGKPSPRLTSSKMRKINSSPKVDTQTNLNKWLLKATPKQENDAVQNNKMYKPLKIKTGKTNSSTTPSSKTSRKQTFTRINSGDSDDLPTFKSKKQTLTRMDSGDSDDLPIFKSKRQKRTCKTTKFLKKYGVQAATPSKIRFEEKDLEEYKTKVTKVQAMMDVPLKEPVFPKLPSPSKNQQVLDCKHLTLNEITQQFHSHKQFLKEIIDGERFSDRHRKYHDKKAVCKQSLNMNSLTYNTSTIVFTFEQIDRIVTLMGREFDPEDTKTDYFFKVLVPELCLKIFMETHNMSKREASVYLDKRPVD